MSIDNIKARDNNAYAEGFTKGFEAAEANRKLTSITASIFKSVFYRDYHDSFYAGVAEGWQESFNLNKQKLKAQARYQHRQKEIPEERQLDTKAIEARQKHREQQVQQMQQQKKEGPEIDR